MKEFKLEVGGRCSNGATVLELWQDNDGGIVLADWGNQFVTWEFPAFDHTGTSGGNYFMFTEFTRDTSLIAARNDFMRRVLKAGGYVLAATVE